MKVKTNGIEINYEVEGNGPWITLSHSLACNLHMWDEQMELLTRHFKVLRFDTRGHGQSTAPEGDYTLEQLADDVHGLFAHLGIKETHWVGLSMGGMIGQTYALKYPGVFKSLVLADTNYPGWTSTVDGVATPIAQADLVMRAVPLGPGDHEVRFGYDPGWAGRALWAAAGVALACVGVGLRRGR